MTQRIATGLLCCLLLFASPIQAQNWHTTPDKWEMSRNYHTPYRESYDKRLVIDKSNKDIPEEGRVYSPNHGYWLYVEEPEYGKNGPWDTHVYISNEREELIHISLLDHEDYVTRFEWINEKLVYVSIWWGRVLGTYLIYDVEREQVVIKEMVNDGVLPHLQWQQVRQPKPVVEEQ